MSVLECPNCHRPTKEGARFCTACGTLLTPLNCPACYASVDPDDRFCPVCGTRLPATTSQTSRDAWDDAAMPPTRDAIAAVSVPASMKPQSPAFQQETPGVEARISQPAEEARSRPPGNWHLFKNAWYGFTLEKPIDWFARTFKGVTTVAPNTEGYVGVIIRQLQVHQGSTAEELARHIAGAMRKVLSSFNAWGDPPPQGESSGARMLVMRYSGTYKQVPLMGVFVLRIRDDVALVSGFQAPANQMGQLAPTMQYIMTSLRFIEPLALQSYTESNEGAFSGSIPRGWSIIASMSRSPDSSRTPLTHIRAVDPTGTISMEAPPQYEQFTEQMNPMMMMSGGIRYMPVQSAAQYIQRVLIPRILQQHRGAQIEGIEHRADLSEYETMEAARTDHFGFGTICDVASVTYTTTQDGVLYRTKDFLQITHIRAAHTWTTRVSAILRAPAEQFEEQEAIMAGMIESIQPNQQWMQREQARSDQYFMQAQQRLAHVQQQQVMAIQNLHQTQLDIAESMRADINRRTANFSALQQDMDRVIAGYQYVYDPIDQKVYDVAVGPGQLWGGDGYVYRSDSGITPPKLGLHRLEPLG